MTQYHPNGTHEGEAANDPGVAGRAREQIDERMGEAREAAMAAREQALDAMTRSSQETARFVRENPATALAGALGIGVLIGLALGTGRR